MLSSLLTSIIVVILSPSYIDIYIITAVIALLITVVYKTPPPPPRYVTYAHHIPYATIYYISFVQWSFQEPKLEVPIIYKAYVMPM